MNKIDHRPETEGGMLYARQTSVWRKIKGTMGNALYKAKTAAVLDTAPGCGSKDSVRHEVDMEVNVNPYGLLEELAYLDPGHFISIAERIKTYREATGEEE